MLHKLYSVRRFSLVDRLDGSGVFQGAGHSLGRGGDAHVQRQDIIADGRATFQIHLLLLQDGSAASQLCAGPHKTPNQHSLWTDGQQQACSITFMR